ncbi:MAG TPA: hypothetical protein PKC49_13200, partial [Phycisphaerae bacterium]|nr:hypothetical protein [Phycisphaerae bacterium]
MASRETTPTAARRTLGLSSAVAGASAAASQAGETSVAGWLLAARLGSARPASPIAGGGRYDEMLRA